MILPLCNLCRKEMVESWKSNVLRIVLLYGVMTVVLVWNGYFAYRTQDSVRFLERHMEADPAWGFILIAFLWFLFGFGCLSGSLTMEKMKSKTNRLSVLMTPATPFEKFFSRWLVSTVVLLVVFFITFELADYTRVLVYSLIYPDVKEVILPVNLGDLVGSGKRWYLFHKTYELTLVLSIYCFVHVYRQDIYELPPDSIRELIVNAIMNCSYIQASNIQVAIYDDRLEITSPGGLLPGVYANKCGRKDYGD